MESRLLSDIYHFFILSGRDNRYEPEGYGFVLASLDYIRSKRELEGHVESQVVIDGVLELAKMKFGPMAKSVLNNWGINAPMDIGTIVYNLIDMDILSRSSDDELDKFNTAENFDELLKSRDSYRINKKRLKIFKDS